MKKTVNLHGKQVTIDVIHTKEAKSYITEDDHQMDILAKEAVKAAISKAEICKKPIAKYDTKLNKAYLQYANGEKVYAK